MSRTLEIHRWKVVRTTTPSCSSIPRDAERGARRSPTASKTADGKSLLPEPVVHEMQTPDVGGEVRTGVRSEIGTSAGVGEELQMATPV